MPDSNSSIAILGAGITGLSVAYALKKRGIPALVYEKDPAPGGVIQTHQENAWLVEKGPNTMLVRNGRIWALLDELELSGRIARPGGEAKRRYIIRNRTLCAAPMSLTDFFRTDLLSTGAKFRLLREPFVSAPRDGRNDESIAHFIRRRLGSEPLNYAVNPFVSGIYAGDPEALSVKHTFSSLYEMQQKYGSITKGFFKRTKESSAHKRALVSFDGGLHILPQAMGRRLGDSLLTNTRLRALSKVAGGWQLRLQHGEKVFEVNHPTVISTLPIHCLSKVWRNEHSVGPISELAQIPYAPMSVLALGFRQEQVAHSLDGFGMLIPEKEPFSMLGCLFSSSLFEGRAPEEHALLTCFIGGARHPELASRSTKELTAEIMPQLQELLRVKGEPVFRDHTFWEKAIPQYTVGYDCYLEVMSQIERQNSGLYLAGNYRGGVSVPDCILNGFEMAKRVEQNLA